MPHEPRRNDLPVEALVPADENTAVAVSTDGDLVIGGFKLTSTRLIPVGQPDFESWDQVGRFLQYVHTGSQFWIGDWINYGESRYGEKYTQAVSRTGYQLSTLETYAWVARQVAPENRKEKVPFGHYVNSIAALEPNEQQEWVQRIIDEELSQAELRTKIRLAKRRAVAGNVALPEGTYRVICADNPWAYDDSGEIKGTAYGKAERHYPTMPIGDIVAFYKNLNERGTFADDSVLFMWVPEPLLMQNPGPRDVIEAAGFTHKSGFIWWKDKHVYGHYVSVQHEHLLICTRGSCTPDEPTPMPASVIKYKLTKETAQHSAKPDVFFKVIDKLYPIGPKLELFGRERRDGWTVYGNDPNVQIGTTPNEAVVEPNRKSTRNRIAEKRRRDDTRTITTDGDDGEPLPF